MKRINEKVSGLTKFSSDQEDNLVNTFKEDLKKNFQKQSIWNVFAFLSKIECGDYQTGNKIDCKEVCEDVCFSEIDRRLLSTIKVIIF